MNVVAFIPGTAAWRRRRDIALCRQATEHLDEIVDAELGTGKAKALERHLAACQRCGAEAEAVQALKAAICRVSGDADPEVVQRLTELAQKLCREGEARAT